MAASVLNSPSAIEISVYIVRAFVLDSAEFPLKRPSRTPVFYRIQRDQG